MQKQRDEAAAKERYEKAIKVAETAKDAELKSLDSQTPGPRSMFDNLKKMLPKSYTGGRRRKSKRSTKKSRKSKKNRK